MRPAVSAPRRSARGIIAGLGLAAVVAVSACSPLARTAQAASSGGASAVRAVTHSKPNTQAVYAVRVAKAHNVSNAPAVTGYPWASDQTNAPDAYGLTRRQCVSYAAWYLNVHGTPFGYNTKGPSGTAVFGNATDWDGAAKRAGFTVSATPKVGTIAQWHANEISTWAQGNMYYTFSAGSVGHVGVVVKVYADRSVDVAQYNLGEGRTFSINHMKAPRYLYLPLANPHVR